MTADLDTTPDADLLLQLDRSLPNLHLDQVTAMGELAARFDHAAARVQAINDVVDRRLTTRWARWSPIFGLPSPPADRPLTETLLYPYAAVGRPHPRLAPYLTGVLAVFDAALALACADRELSRLLGAPWRAVCPAVAPEAEFGPHTVAVRAALTTVPRRARFGTAWAEASSAVDHTAATWGVPFLPRHLRILAGGTTNNDLSATDAGHPDTNTAEAIWGAAVAAALDDRLPPTAREILQGC